MKRIIGNPSQSTMGLNDLLAATNVFYRTIINVTSFNGVENENAIAKKKGFPSSMEARKLKTCRYDSKGAKKMCCCWSYS
jgi:hypothetical protein